MLANINYFVYYHVISSLIYELHLSIYEIQYMVVRSLFLAYHTKLQYIRPDIDYITMKLVYISHMSWLIAHCSGLFQRWLSPHLSLLQCCHLGNMSHWCLSFEMHSRIIQAWKISWLHVVYYSTQCWWYLSLPGQLILSGHCNSHASICIHRFISYNIL